MPGCDKIIEGKSADEVFAKAEDHARKEHNMTIILPSTMSQIEAAIRDKP
jgi:predicted small metal-binding protein